MQIVNRVASVSLRSSSSDGSAGVDIVATALDASGSPVPGRCLSCWVRSTCGLSADLVPGWAETYAWMVISRTIGVGPFNPPSSATLFMPRYCSGAGYPKYVRLFSTVETFLFLADDVSIFRYTISSKVPMQLF